MESNEEKETYTFIRLPKKASLLLDGNERSLFGVMIDYQQMIDSRKETKGNRIEMSISYLVKNLGITDKTVQKAINKLIQLELINKQSGAISRKKNSYSINFKKIQELDKLSNDQLFELRNTGKKAKAAKNEATADVVEQPQPQPTELTLSEQTKIENEPTQSEILTKFEQYFTTKNNGDFYCYDDCISALHDYFNEEELKHILENIPILKENGKVPRLTLDSTARELKLYVPPKPTTVHDYGINF